MDLIKSNSIYLYVAYHILWMSHDRSWITNATVINVIENEKISNDGISNTIFNFNKYHFPEDYSIHVATKIIFVQSIRCRRINVCINARGLGLHDMNSSAYGRIIIFACRCCFLTCLWWAWINRRTSETSQRWKTALSYLPYFSRWPFHKATRQR